MAKGIKVCPQCGKTVGARTLKCECGYEFASAKKGVSAPKTPKAHLSGGKGKKQCPQCQLIVGARTKVCSCGYVFISDEKTAELKAKKEEQKVQAETVNPIVKELEEVELPELNTEEVEKLTPEQHVERILARGPERAKSLMKLARAEKRWTYIDWDMVEQKLTEMEVVEEVEAEEPVQS